MPKTDSTIDNEFMRQAQDALPEMVSTHGGLKRQRKIMAALENHGLEEHFNALTPMQRLNFIKAADQTGQGAEVLLQQFSEHIVMGAPN